MARSFRKQGSTEPEELTLSATGLTNLDNLTQARFYLREVGGTANKVNGAILTVVSSPNRTLSFDPDGAAVGGGGAFADVGVFQSYVRATWSDGDTTRHPDKGYEEWEIDANFE